ncbi:MAG: hypothetical protein AAF633_19505 [Chloroflexota bacterium]
MSTREPLEFGRYYHVYNRGNNGQCLFPENRNYPYFLTLYAKYLSSVATTYAYCLLPNHFHLLLRTMSQKEQKQLKPFEKVIHPSRAFNNMFIAYTKAINKAHGWTGALFERPFKRKPVMNEVYFQNLVVYIHQNPQKHGYVTDFRDWKFSSWGAMQTESSTKLARKDVFDWFGGIQKLEQAQCVKADEHEIYHLINEDRD